MSRQCVQTQMASPTPYTLASTGSLSLSPLPSIPTLIERSNPNGLPRGRGMLILSFLILWASFSLSLLRGSRMAVRMLLALPLRE